MKQFLAFVIKEFYHILRDRRTMLILLGMPVVEIILFGFAITNEVKDVRIAILDPSKDAVTEKIIYQLNANEYLEVVKYIHNTDEINHVFRKDEADIVVVFNDHFDSNLQHTGTAQIQIIVDGTDPNMAAQYTGYVSSVIGMAQTDIVTGSQFENIPIQIESVVKLLYNPRMKGAYNFVPGVMGLILMLICAMMTSISIVREKETGTMEVLLVSPMKPIFIIIAKTIPYFVLSCVNLVSILLLSVYVLGVPIAGSLFWLSAVSLLFIFVSLALGLLISNLTRTQVDAMLISGMVLMMPVMLLSGMIFPIESMPSVLQWLSNILPAKWYISAVKKIMIEGLDVRLVIEEISILTAMAVLLLVVSLKKFNNRLE